MPSELFVERLVLCYNGGMPIQLNNINDFKLLKLVLFRYINICKVLGDTEKDLKEFTELKKRIDKLYEICILEHNE